MGVSAWVVAQQAGGGSRGFVSEVTGFCPPVLGWIGVTLHGRVHMRASGPLGTLGPNVLGRRAALSILGVSDAVRDGITELLINTPLITWVVADDAVGHDRPL